MNVAARLEQAASAEEVLLSETTFRLVRDAVEVEAAEPLSLKGKSDRVPAFRLVAVHSGVEAIRRRVDARMVGRRSELQAILDGFESAVRQKTGRLVTVVGEAGVGKTTLLRETMLHLRTKAKVVSGRCPAYGAGTFWPLGEALSETLGITATDTPEMVVARVRSFLKDDEDGVGDRIASLLLVTDATYPIEETFWATRRFFEDLAREGPLVLIFEDLHWASKASWTSSSISSQTSGPLPYSYFVPRAQNCASTTLRGWTSARTRHTSICSPCPKRPSTR